jgi:hypothetical protein
MSRLSIHIVRGSVIVDDFRIDGVQPGDRPFFTAKRLELGLDWSSVFRTRPEFIISSVEMTDWQMLVEKWPGRNNFPKFVDNNRPDTGQRRFTATMKYLRAWRGRFVFEDHEVPWSVDAPNIDLNITNLPRYRGTATFKGGTIKIQDHLPMWGDFRAAFVLDGPKVHLPRIDIITDGAETTASGDRDFAHWPNMQYAVKSRVHFPRMREIFFTTRSGGRRRRRLTACSGVNHGHNERMPFTALNAGSTSLIPRLRTLQWNEHGFDGWNVAGSEISTAAFEIRSSRSGKRAGDAALRRDGGPT